MSPAGTEEKILLNRTAHEIWQLCNGWRRLDEISGILACWYGTTPDRLRDEVETTISELQRTGLIEQPRVKGEVVEITLQAENDYRGLFAIFHYIWSTLYVIKSDCAKRVVLLDGDTDYWNALFEPCTDLVAPGAPVTKVHPRIASKVMAAHPDLIRENFDSEVLPHYRLPWPNGRRYARVLGDRATRRRMHRVMSCFIRPRPWILEAVDTFWQVKCIEPTVIGLHLRASNHIGVVMDPERYIEDVVAPQVERYVAESGIEDYQVFVATHVGEYQDHCRKRFGDRMVAREIARIDDPGIQFNHLDTSLFEKGRDVLIDALLLARCDVLMGIPSNVLTASLLFNPNCALVIFDYALSRSENGEFSPPPS